MGRGMVSGGVVWCGVVCRLAFVAGLALSRGMCVRRGPEEVPVMRDALDSGAVTSAATHSSSVEIPLALQPRGLRQGGGAHSLGRIERGRGCRAGQRATTAIRPRRVASARVARPGQ